VQIDQVPSSWRIGRSKFGACSALRAEFAVLHQNPEACSQATSLRIKCTLDSVLRAFSTIWFSLNHKRQSRKRSRKWKLILLQDIIRVKDKRYELRAILLSLLSSCSTRRTETRSKKSRSKSWGRDDRERSHFFLAVYLRFRSTE